MPRSFKLTWQLGAGQRPGRWRKKHRGKVYYFAGGRGKSDREAYMAALQEWEELKVEIDAQTPKRHQAAYEREIGLWDTVLVWCRANTEQEMALTATEKQARLRKGLAAAKPRPIRQEDTFGGQFERSVRDPSWRRTIVEIGASIEAASVSTDPMPNDTAFGRAFNAAREELAQLEIPSQAMADSIIDPKGIDMEVTDPLQREKDIWQDRLDVMKRSAASVDQSTQAHQELFLKEKRAAVKGGELTPGRYDTIQRYVTEFVTWLGGSYPVADINGKTLTNYRIELLQRAEAKRTETNGGSQATTKDRLDTVKSFIRWLWHIEAIPTLPRNMDSRSGGLKISNSPPAVVVFEKVEIGTLLKEASERIQLYILLMLNCGMTQKDIADLNHSEVDWERGRITRKRSKTRHFENVPEVSYVLWPRTRSLLRKHRTNAGQGPVLVNAGGGPLRYEEVQANGKFKKNDNIRTAFSRLQRKTGITKPLKSLKKTSASLIRSDPRYASLESLFLGHAPQSMSDKHYTVAPQALLDDAVIWLGTEYGLSGGETLPGET